MLVCVKMTQKSAISLDESSLSIRAKLTRLCIVSPEDQIIIGKESSIEEYFCLGNIVMQLDTRVQFLVEEYFFSLIMLNGGYC